MKEEWPENEKIGELLFQLQQLSISTDWLVQELHYSRKRGIHNPDQYIKNVQEKIDELSTSYRNRLGKIKNEDN